MAMNCTSDTIFNFQPNARSRMGHNFQGISIRGGKVQMGDTQYNYHYDPLSHLDSSKNARFNSKYRQHAQICQEKTRTELLRDIYNWVDGEDERHIFWLQGLAGTGKSTIAQTVAKHYYDLDPKQLAASFFFARGGGDASHAGLFATSIAVQLANDVPLLRDAVCKAITKCSDIASRSLSDQWRRLVLEPFSNLEVTHSPSSYLIVIDALDECNSENDIHTILQLLSETQQLTPLRLRFFLTSRPDTAIRRGFESVPTAKRRDTVLHEIAPAVIDHDITLYLNHQFAVIGREQYIGPSWPTEWQARQLVNQSSGLFIWAATACRYIREGRNHANERLSEVLKTQTRDSAPEKELDAIYTMVLRNSVPDRLSEKEKGTSFGLLGYILGSVVVLFTPLSIQALHSLLEISLNEIKRTVIDLHSILHIPPEETDELRLHHPSFRDYLVSTTRCGLESLQVDEKSAHRKLLMRCLLLMSTTLKENICDLNYSNPGILREEVEEKRIQQSIHPALRYACLHWVQHLGKSGEMIYDKDQVDNFMRQHLLAWLEALIWVGKAAESIQAATDIQSIASTDTCPLFYQYIQDVKRFISHSLSIVERAPLQLYLSALIFTPENSHVRTNFQQRVFRWMNRLPVMEKNWNCLVQTLEGHTKRVSAIAISPDETMLASASADCTVRLWDTATGSTRQILEGHTGWVIAIAFSSDGTTLVSVSADYTIRLWDTATGSTHRILKSHTNWVSEIAFSLDGTMLASTSTDCATVQLWDTATGSTRQILEGHTERVIAIAFSPDGTMLASASDDCAAVWLWDTATGSTHQILKGHTKRVSAIAISPDETMLASASADCTVRLWDTATGSTRQILVGHTGLVIAIAFSPDGTMLALVSDDYIVQLWDTATGSTRQILKGHTNRVRAIAFSPDGAMLASASDDWTVQLWDTATGSTRQILVGHTNHVSAIAFFPDRTMLASVSDDCTVRLWDIATGSTHQTLEGHTERVNSIIFSLDGTMLASASNDCTVRLWDTATGSTHQILKGHTDQVGLMAFSLDRSILASASDDWTVRLWDTATGSMRQILEGHTGWVSEIAFSPDGTMLASASNDCTVRLWDTATGSTHQILKGHTDQVGLMAFSLDGTILASASNDCTVRLWDTATGSTRQILSHTERVRAIAFSSDGTVVITGRGKINLNPDDIISYSPQQHLAPASALVVKDQWVACNGYHVLWLPPEYRSNVSALYATKVAIGCSSGRILLFELHIF